MVPYVSKKIRSTELSLLCFILALKCVLFYLRMGKRYGEDSGSFISTIDRYRESGVLPDLKYSLTSYHPPSSFILIKTLSDISGVSTTQAAQILSFCSLIASFFLLRALLKKIEVLYTPVGMTFLYTIAMLPILLNLSMASTYDSQVFLLGMLSLYVSIRLFWNPHEFSLRKPYCLFLCSVLSAILFWGLMTKFTCLLFLSFPFIVILVRWKKDTVFKQIAAALLVCAIAGGSAMPYYYQRYYKRTGDWIPSPMEWLIPTQFEKAKKYRDKNKLEVILHFIRIPTTSFVGGHKNASIIYEIWYDIWKNDIKHKNSILKLTPNIMVHAAIPVFLFGLFTFLWHQRKRGPPLTDLGWILTGCAAVFILANLYFAYQNPYLPWRVFKAKYSPLTIVWIAYIFAVGSCALSKKFQKYFRGKTMKFSVMSVVAIVALVTHTSTIV